MLRAEPFDQHVAARLLDFFAAETAWQRRLWDVGSCLTLREIVEATEAVADRVLSTEALDWLRRSALPVVGRDPGVGTPEERSTLTAALKGNVVQGSFDTKVIEIFAASASAGYLDRWAAVIEVRPVGVGPERTARALASHLVDLGFGPDYLHRWWTYRISYADGEHCLADLVREAGQRVLDPPTEHDVIIPLRRATERVTDVPGWLPPAEASELLTPINHRPIASLAGAVRLTITATDPGAAVEEAADLIDRYTARITLGGGNEGLEPLPYVWVSGGGAHRRMRLRRGRGLVLPVLRLRTDPITHPVAPGIDSPLELLGPVDRGPNSSAAAAAWAAVETLLTAPGDRAKVYAADRLASLIACSFPRAELTQLAHRFVERDSASDPTLAEHLSTAETNTAGAGRLARYLADNDVAFSDPSDAAAAARIKAIILSPNQGLGDIEDHLLRPIRRLYRVRNLVLHNAATEAVTLVPALRSGVPLLAAGIDRVVRGALLQDVEAIGLAAAARIAIDKSDTLEPGDLADLLQLAATPDEPADVNA